MPEQADLLTADEASARLRLSPEGLRRLIRLGRIKAVKIGRRYMIAPEEIERIKREGTAPVVLAGGRQFERAPRAEEEEQP